MLPPELPPPIPFVEPAPSVEISLGFEWVAKEPVKKKKKIGPKRMAFEYAVKDFQEGLGKLPAVHKKEILKFHREVDKWADKKHARGEKADKLANFVARVMMYLDKQLRALVKDDPQLKRRKAEHRQMQGLFMKGNAVIEAYHDWIKAKDEDEPKPKKKSKARKS